MLWIETPTNPTLKIVDIESASKIAKKFPVRQNIMQNIFFSNLHDIQLKAFGGNSCTLYHIKKKPQKKKGLLIVFRHIIDHFCIHNTVSWHLVFAWPSTTDADDSRA